eukprot:TRINITY_DN5671_c0_g1_i3.p1 TRINITY_DN5671_c0_g1~~TRINITY_DN5671_c0_g1_i3.p1  ORF type:complete len:540 (-),score=63.47 TRINITY_DN5671_c0_g1_i3:256-1875(-)
MEEINCPQCLQLTRSHRPHGHYHEAGYVCKRYLTPVAAGAGDNVKGAGDNVRGAGDDLGDAGDDLVSSPSVPEKRKLDAVSPDATEEPTKPKVSKSPGKEEHDASKEDRTDVAMEVAESSKMTGKAEATFMHEEQPPPKAEQKGKAKATLMQEEQLPPKAQHTDAGSVPPVAHPQANMLKDHPIFGRIFTYSEVLQKASPRVPEDFVEPDCWPPNTRADRSATALQCAWLPEDWFPAWGTTARGNDIKCFISIEGKRFWHKPKLVEYLGIAPSSAKSRKEDNGNVKDPSLWPSWPRDNWLPQDWLLVYRQRGASGLHKCFVDPKVSGFFYQRADVEAYLATGHPQPTSFSESFLQSEKKTHRQHRDRIVKSSDYEEATWLAVTRLPSLTSDVQQALKSYGKLATMGRLVKSGKEISAWLLQRGFAEQTDMVAIFCNTKKTPDHVLIDWVSGWYYCRTTFGDRPCYMGIDVDPETNNVFCKGIYVFWCAPHGCWKAAATIDDERAGLVKCSQDVKLPSDATEAWQIVSMSTVVSWQPGAE